MIPIDLHTHSIASGHGTTETITDMAKTASAKGLTVLGISDHAPSTPGSCKESYFCNLRLAPKKREQLSILYGIEANILDQNGTLDFSSELFAHLDYIIASIHAPCFLHTANSPASCNANPTVTATPAVITNDTAITTNTNAYINVMKNPYVKIIGHPDDAHFPVDAKKLVEAAAYYHVILEVNEASLAPNGYRGNTLPIMKEILSLCKMHQLPILLSSDSHGSANIGSMPYALKLVSEMNYPKQWILNFQPIETFLQFRS